MKNDHPGMLDYMEAYFRDHFFPELESRGVDTIIHLGDLVDRRKYINYRTASVLREAFLEPATRYQTHILVGNHDAFYKNTNEINALGEIVGNRYSGVRIYSGPSEIEVDGVRILLLPWICDQNRGESGEAIRETRAEYCMGHLELTGFKMYKSSPEAQHGTNPRILDKFKSVLSGHFHHMSGKGNVLYVGAPYEMTWADYDDLRGFHILDTTTMELEHVPNLNPLYLKIQYDNGSDFDGSVRGKIVKLIVKERENGLAFDQFVGRLEEDGPMDLQVVEDHLHLDVLTPDEDVSVDVEDTPVLLRKSVMEIREEGIDKVALSDFLLDVYSEAYVRR